MSRLEKPPMPLQDFARMEREIATVSSGPTKKHSRAFFGCGILCLMFLGVCALVAWVLAASGLVRVPIFSSLAYEESAPIRVVDSTNAESLERVLERAINTAQSPELSVRLSEASLTASLRAELSTLDQPYFTAAGSQMAVEGESLEVYLPLKTTPQTNNALTARVRLLAQDGGFAAEVSSVRIGGVRLR